MNVTYNFEGRIALVTGGNSGMKSRHGPGIFRMAVTVSD